MLRHRRLHVALALALLVAPALARASATPATTDGLGNLFRYASCAVSVFVAQTPGQWVLAFAACAELFHDAI